MAWNQMALDPHQKLLRTASWETKGLGYWNERLAQCERRIREGETSRQIRRAMEDRDVARAAVWQLSGRP